MVTKQLSVRGNLLRSAKAGNFVDVVSGFNSSIYFEQENKRINAKSIIGVLSMNLNDGDEIRVLADGSDEEQAIEAVNSYIEKGIEE